MKYATDGGDGGEEEEGQDFIRSHFNSVDFPLIWGAKDGEVEDVEEKEGGEKEKRRRGEEERGTRLLSDHQVVNETHTAQPIGFVLRVRLSI